MLARYHSNICWVQMSAVCSPDICLETLTLAKYICQAVSTRPCVSSMLTLPGAVEFVQEKATWESVYTLDFSHFSLFKSWLLSTWPHILKVTSIIDIGLSLSTKTVFSFRFDFVHTGERSFCQILSRPRAILYLFRRHLIVTRSPIQSSHPLFSIQPLLSGLGSRRCAKYPFRCCWLPWSDPAIKSSKVLKGQTSQLAEAAGSHFETAPICTHTAPICSHTDGCTA